MGFIGEEVIQRMKKQLHPAVFVVLIVIVVAGAAALLFKGATDKPAYPGLNAMRPADETATRRDKPGPTGTPKNYEEAKKMRIPGMNPNAPPPVPPSNPPGR
jgi:hypothetical protein